MSTKTQTIVLATTPLLEEVAELLRSGEHDVRVVRDVEQDGVVAGETGTMMDPGVVVLGTADALAALEPGVRHVLLEIRAGGAQSAKSATHDVLVWPDERDGLVQRIAVLGRQAAEATELRLRRACSALLVELGSTIDGCPDFEEGLHEALAVLAEGVDAERALLLAWQRGAEPVYLLGASDDPGVSRAVAAAKAYPEIRERDAFDQRLVTAAPVDERVAVYAGRGEGERRRDLLLVPIRHKGDTIGMLELHFPTVSSPTVSSPTVSSPIGRPLPAAVGELVRQLAMLLAPRLRGSDAFSAMSEQTRRVSLLEIERDRQPRVLRQYEEFYERSVDGIVVLDEQDRVVYLNPAGAQITGYSKEGLNDKPLDQFVVDEDREHLRALLAEVRGEGAGHSFEVGMLTTSGDPILVSVSTSAVLSDDGALVLSFRDVTEARALSDELRATKEFLESLIDSAIDAIVAADNSGRIVLLNKGAEALLGYDEEEVVGQLTMRDLFQDGVGEKVMDLLRGDEHGGLGRLAGLRKEIVTKSKEIVPVSLSASLIYEGDVEVGTVTLFRDLRDRLRIERRLFQAQERLHETEKQALIAELAGTTAHELNQPLTSVMGFAELLRKRLGGDETISRVVDTLLGEAERMAEIVRKIGKITKYETKAYVGVAQILDLDKSSK